jgi:hypothetical protein
VRVWRFQGGWVWGSWDGIGSRFVEDEDLDGLRDARRASPAVQLETLVLGNRWLPAIDSLVTSDDDFASLHWYEIFAEFLWVWSSLNLRSKRMGEQQRTTIASAFSLGTGDSKCAMYFKPRFAPGDNVSLNCLRLSLAIVSHPASYRVSADFLLNSTSIQGGPWRRRMG